MMTDPSVVVEVLSKTRVPTARPDTWDAKTLRSGGNRVKKKLAAVRFNPTIL